MGSSLDTFLSEEDIRDAANAAAVTRMVSWHLTQEMERQGMTKATLAEEMHTNRVQVERILKAKGNITIQTLPRGKESRARAWAARPEARLAGEPLRRPWEAGRNPDETASRQNPNG